uniref:LisH domain-containing protein ARMC9 n=1 Tax=Macrostomum lignano TaxID=282301 RepID=A0A1I8H2E9_9PLAT
MSAFVSTVAYETELNNIVKEYLESLGYDQTSAAFDRECAERSKPVPSVPAALRTNSASVTAQKTMLRHFHKGEREAFFQLWEQQLSHKLRQVDSVAQKLEFYLHIYFATYSVRHEGITDDEAVSDFRHFLETKGAQLSQTTEFLPFYALPYPSELSDVFSDRWVPELQLRLERFLAMVLDFGAEPVPPLRAVPGRRLRLCWRLRDRSAAGMFISPAFAAHSQAQLVEAERRATQYVRRHNKVQADYHNLIGITAELVDTLEASLQGRPVNPQFLQQICARLFQAQTGSLDLTRPGSAGQALRQSVRDSGKAAANAVPASAGAASASAAAAAGATDYDRLRRDLASSDDALRAGLLQALRWRLTRAEGEARQRCVGQWVSHDLLGMAGQAEPPPLLLGCLRSNDRRVRESAGRLLNAFASVCRGRTYLTSGQASDSLLQALVQLCRESPEDQTGSPAVRDQLVGALQKLSLRRRMQTGMIRRDLIDWLADQLAEHDGLSDYGLEYTVALLMNLCLRTAGKKYCSPPRAKKVLKVLSDLLGHENRDILPYVNGALYSILAVPAIRAEARAMDLEAVLNCFIKEDSPDMNRQLEFIIRQLNSEEEAELRDSEDEAEPDDDEDEEADVIEPDVDRDDSVAHSPSGEALLRNYSPQQEAGSAAATSGELLTRPALEMEELEAGQQQQQQQQQQRQDTGRRPRTGGDSRPVSTESRPRTGQGDRKARTGTGGGGRGEGGG